MVVKASLTVLFNVLFIIIHTHTHTHTHTHIYIYNYIYIIVIKHPHRFRYKRNIYLIHYFVSESNSFILFILINALFAALHLHFVHPGIYWSTLPALHFCFQDLGFFDQLLQSNGLFWGNLQVNQLILWQACILKTGVDPLLGMLEHWIEVTLNTELQNVWKWSLTHYCMIKIFWKILASSIFLKSIICFVFLKSPVRIRAPHCLKRAVHLKVRNSCVKLYTWIDYLFIISNFFEKVKKCRSRLLKEEDQTINEINAVLKIE